MLGSWSFRPHRIHTISGEGKGRGVFGTWLVVGASIFSPLARNAGDANGGQV